MCDGLRKRMLRVQRLIEVVDDEQREHITRLAERAAMLSTLKVQTRGESLESLVGRFHKL